MNQEQARAGDFFRGFLAGMCLTISVGCVIWLIGGQVFGWGN